MQRKPALWALPFIAALLIAACGGYSIYWNVAAGEIRAGIDRWADNRRAKGWTVELGAPSTPSEAPSFWRICL